ncbi:MAG: helix-turn-helix transcriptional regulator [Pseudomonadota bacterium]
MTATALEPFPALCRQWRQFRKLSQLDLALAADVSQRHVSWLETGRSTPSRSMIQRLSEAMEVPLRDRNALFQAAGFVPPYAETDLDEPVMTPVLDAMNHVLAHHEPLPAIVVDRMWNVRKLNRAADRMLSLTGDPAARSRGLGSGDALNLALLSLHPDGLRRHIRNWDAVAPSFIRRLRQESMATVDPSLKRHLEQLVALAGDVAECEPLPGLLPFLPLELELGGTRLSLFSVISTLGTPQDVTTDELRIEAFYPSDENTRRFFAEQVVS